MNEADLLNVMSGRDRSARARLMRLGLGALTPGYRAAVMARNAAFDTGVRKPTRLGRQTISIGNLTTGGTGKTPMVMHVATRLLEIGAKPAILLRGYAAGASGSDEAMQYRGELPDVPVEPDPDRAAGARRVLAAHPDVGVFVLDDGFQHRQVHRDLDLVLIDATNPFGYDRLLPRGLLREPVGALRRADGVIVTRADQATRDALADIEDRIAGAMGKPPLAHAAMRWAAYRHNDALAPAERLRGVKVAAICGIGNPVAFERTLRQHVRNVALLRVFGDHHAYTQADWFSVLGDARRAGAEALVMTEKDWVKWQLLEQHEETLPVYRPILSIEFLDGSEALDALLRKTIRA